MTTQPQKPAAAEPAPPPSVPVAEVKTDVEADPIPAPDPALAKKAEVGTETPASPAPEIMELAAGDAQAGTGAAPNVADATATTAAIPHHEDDSTNPPDFEGAVDSNNDLPSAETLARIADYVLLDRHGKTHTFKSLYTGKHAARRVLIIFVRHFFCGNCQEYLRSLSSSITPDALLRLPLSTFIAVVGCGDPGLIDMYAAETGCPFPIYADPTRKLYAELGMVRTLALGARPAYTTQGLLKSSLASVVQGLKQIKSGLAVKGGDARQVGGEFLFEPLDLQSPVTTPWGERGSSGFKFEGMGKAKQQQQQQQQQQGSSDTSLDGKNEGEEGAEEKRVTWCHRMRTTRDHAEIPELMEVLGLDGQGMPIKDKKRWSKALETRKGTGLSMASQMSAMKAEAGTVP